MNYYNTKEAMAFAGYCCALCNKVEIIADRENGYLRFTAIAKSYARVCGDFSAVFDIENGEFLLDHIMIGNEDYDSRFDDDFMQEDENLIGELLHPLLVEQWNSYDYNTQTLE